MGQLLRIAVVGGSVVAIAASVACGGGNGGGSASPTAVVATPAIAATSTVGAAAVSPSPVASATAPAPAPTATAEPQTSGGGGNPLPTAVQATPTTPPPTRPAEESLTIVAKDVKFSPTSLTAKAGGVVHLTLDNRDAGVPHDIIVYDASGAVVGATDPATGPVQQTLTVTLGPPQRYTFKCSVHPLTMNGTLVVQ